MTTYGIHLGYFTIRISKCFKRPGENSPTFRSVEIPPYGINDWWPYFQGALPNCFDPELQTIGYEALGNVDEFEITRLRRFDSRFFQSLLSDDAESVFYQKIWVRLLSTLVQDYIRSEDVNKFAFYLDGVHLIEQKNQWMPWNIKRDRTNELVGKLSQLASQQGFEDVIMLDERKITETHVLKTPQLLHSDLLLNIGGEQSSFWLILNPGRGEILPLENCPGYKTLIPSKGKLSRDLFLMLLRVLVDEKSTISEDLASRIKQWQREYLEPARFRAWKKIGEPDQMEKSKRASIWITGEGAHLIREKNESIKLLNRPLYWLADTASEIIFQADA